ncbi:hypothetical protein CW749_07115 [Vibrio sp. vnigr-6D03]|nr:hypothetical protein CW749_07115 [Vibrio sp. vnigr-6D03]
MRKVSQGYLLQGDKSIIALPIHSGVTIAPKKKEELIMFVCRPFSARHFAIVNHSRHCDIVLR